MNLWQTLMNVNVCVGNWTNTPGHVEQWTDTLLHRLRAPNSQEKNNFK